MCRNTGYKFPAIQGASSYWDPYPDRGLLTLMSEVHMLAGGTCGRMVCSEKWECVHISMCRQADSASTTGYAVMPITLCL